MGATAAGKLVPVLEGDPDRRAFIRNGFADASDLRKDVHLAPLRDADEFRQILTALEKPGKP